MKVIKYTFIIVYLVPFVEAGMEGQINAEHLQIQANCNLHP